MGLWTWTPEYPDPEASLTFAPGGNLGLRANWLQGLDQGIDGVTRAARSAFGDERPGSYARWQLQMNSSSPFIPLFVPGRHHAHGDRVTDLPASPVMELDLARVR
jgi:peptide/nickel transport system substrate-binding protein